MTEKKIAGFICFDVLVFQHSSSLLICLFFKIREALTVTLQENSFENTSDTGGWYDNLLMALYTRMRNPIGLAVRRVGTSFSRNFFPESQVHYHGVVNAGGTSFEITCSLSCLLLSLFVVIDLVRQEKYSKRK